MKTQLHHSRFAIVLSVVTGLLFGLAVYSIRLYQFRSLILLVLILVLSGAFGLLLMRLTAGIMAWLVRVEARSLEVPAALSMTSWLVIYFGFPLSFMEISFHEGKEFLIAGAVFLFINLFIFLIMRLRRIWRIRWVILAVLAAAVALGLITGKVFPNNLFKVHIEQFSSAYLFPNRITYSPLPETPSDKRSERSLLRSSGPGLRSQFGGVGTAKDESGGPALFRVHHAGHTRTGFWLNMNQSLETTVVIPEGGFLRFEVGVVHPGKDLAPARILVMAKDSTGKVYKIDEVFINRQKVAWITCETDLSGLSPGKGIIQLQLYSTDEKHENLKPLVISNFTLFSARDRPGGHVILVVLDALRADVLGCYGGRKARTPVIDRLASQGVLFENAMSPCSWTLPAVASILTSRLPSQHGAISYLRVMHDRTLPALPELLAARGIVTKASISNWLIYSKLNYDKGFKDFYLEPLSRVFWRSTDALMRESAEWLRKRSGGPFFLYIHNMDPHHPYLAPEPYSFGSKIMDGFHKLRAWIVFGMRIPYIYGLDLNAVNSLSGPEVEELRQRYLGEVEYVDARMAVLEGALKETGLWEDTLLIITADHGEEFQEHGTIRHGNDLHRELIRVPLIFTGGIMSSRARARRIASPVSLLDLYPTILEFFATDVPPDTLGQSLWPVIKGRQAGGRMVFSEMVEPFNHDYLLISAVKGEYHLIKKVPLEKVVKIEMKLYNWATDPEEQSDLNSYEPEIAQEMEQVMEDFFENLPDKKPLGISLEKGMDETQMMLRALGYLK
jgi:arylsulfatase A-like enzyme